ncbi:hypothetical protein [Nocardiopsis protaetiae]|uniref:hypothetical protein n=1 Tax=Nocardiopsis protaetiae TaxID=3382270 RepID=UPI00387B3F0A
MSRTRRVRGREAGERDRGGASVDLIVLVVPLLLVFLSLIALTGRLYTAAIAADSLAHTAARTASLHTDPGRAHTAAEQAIAGSVGEWERACHAPTLTLQPATVAHTRAVRAEVTCTTRRDDLHLPGLPTERTVTGSAISVLDVHREEQR